MAVRQTLDELRSAVRAKGLRATPSRLAVLQLLRASETPMSHGDVADRLATEAWDRATIYRNLTDLAETGLVRRTDVGDHVWRFEAVSDDHEASAASVYRTLASGRDVYIVQVWWPTTRYLEGLNEALAGEGLAMTPVAGADDVYRVTRAGDGATRANRSR